MAQLVYFDLELTVLLVVEAGLVGQVETGVGHVRQVFVQFETLHYHDLVTLLHRLLLL